MGIFDSRPASFFVFIHAYMRPHGTHSEKMAENIQKGLDKPILFGYNTLYYGEVLKLAEEAPLLRA